MMPGQQDFTQFDGSKLPVPVDDGAAGHLAGATFPDIALPSTDGAPVFALKDETLFKRLANPK